MPNHSRLTASAVCTPVMHNVIKLTTMDYSIRLKERLLANALNLCDKKSFSGIQRESAFLFNDIAMSFYPDTFTSICDNIDYKKRLDKPHSKVPNFKEMQSSNSSDALLMNFFAHPGIKEWKSLRDLISINKSDNIEFGWNPEFSNETSHKTEIDMKIGNSIFEAKLTEKDFTSKELQVVLEYSNVENIIDLQVLTNKNVVSNYQLIRNLLTAEKYDYKFNLLIDESRIDLIREFYKVKSSIKASYLSDNFNFITWQEISNCVGIDLKNYITEKYF